MCCMEQACNHQQAFCACCRTQHCCLCIAALKVAARQGNLKSSATWCRKYLSWQLRQLQHCSCVQSSHHTHLQANQYNSDSLITAARHYCCLADSCQAGKQWPVKFECCYLMKQLLQQQMSHHHLQRLQLKRHWSHGSYGTHSSGAGSANASWHLHLQCMPKRKFVCAKVSMTERNNAMQVQLNQCKPDTALN